MRTIGLLAIVVAITSASATTAQPYRNYKACWACCAACSKHMPLPGKEEPKPDQVKPAPVPVPVPVVPKVADAPDQDAGSTCTDGSCGSRSSRPRLFRWFGR